MTMKKSLVSIAALASLSTFMQSCGVNAAPSDVSNITADGRTNNYVSGKNFPVSQTILRAVLSASSSATLGVNELYGASGEVEGIGITGSVWSYSSSGYYTAVENVTKIYPEDSIIFAYVGDQYKAIGSYTKNEDGTIKMIEDLCTGGYKNSCNLDYDIKSKKYTFKPAT
jgi:hypothetical protein